MNFAKVTDVVIPEGSVTKIVETVGGRILWEKGLNFTPVWYRRTIPQCVTGIYGPNNPATAFIKTMVLDTSSDQSFAPRIKTCTSYSVVSSSGSKTFNTVHPAPYWSFSIYNPFAPGNYLTRQSSVDGNEREYTIYEISDEGKVAYGKINSTSKYAIVCENNSIPYCDYDFPKGLQVFAPTNETEVYITHSSERKEYLVTGISGGTFVLPESFGSGTSINQNGKTLRRTKWVSEHSKYYGVTGKDGYVQSSIDGYTWTQKQVFSGSIVLGVEYLSKKGKLCAISSTGTKIALSSDGETWNNLDVPFTNALAYAYAPDYDLLCVVTNKKGYVTRDLTIWREAELPETVNFRKLIYLTQGVFIGHECMKPEFYALTTIEELNP